MSAFLTIISFIINSYAYIFTNIRKILCICKYFLIKFIHNINCASGKDGYLTYYAAKNALRQRKKGDKEIYLCSICGHYHLTSKQNSDNIKRRKYRRKQNRSTSTKPNFPNASDFDLNYEKVKKQYYRGDFGKHRPNNINSYYLKSTDLGDMLAKALVIKLIKSQQILYITKK